jgi:Putative transposase/Transposase zinc-binding domain
MHGPPLEVADLVRSAGRNFIERNRSWLNRLHLKVLTAIERCRTAALGGHLDQCVRCGHRAISFNSCRNRHCPKCQANARDRWLEARQRELLPTRYVHVVSTLPHELAPLALQNKRVLYELLFRISAETLLEIARDPKHLGAEIGFFSVLHSWNQKLEYHPHVHCVVPAGGLAPDHTHWVPSQRKFFLPGDVLAEVFRGKFREALEEAFVKGELGFHGSMKTFARPKVFAQLLRLTFRKKWVVYLKRPFGGPEHALRYLGCYTHRVAISNHRLVSFADHQVTFRWRDSKHGNKRRLMSLHVNEFLRRFLLHVLPPGFVRIRHFGFLSTRNRSKLLPVCFQLLAASSAEPVRETCRAEHQTHPSWLCPRCQGRMLQIERFTALQLRLRAPPDLLSSAA